MCKRYKIVWLDDDCNNDNGQQNIEMFETLGLDVVKALPCRNDALRFIKTTSEHFDALILDARCPNGKDDVPDWEGLNSFVIEIAKSFPNLPYAIFTGQPDLVDDSSFHKLFEGKVFHKAQSQEKDLVNYIKSQIESVPRNEVKLLYDDVFEALEELQVPDEHCNSLLNILVAHHKPELAGVFSSFDFYNALRRILEVVFRKLAELEILPSEVMIDSGGRVNLNQCALFLAGRHAEKVKALYVGPQDKLTPKYIDDIIRFTLSVATAHSHSFDVESKEYRDDEEDFVGTANSKYLIFGMAINLCEVIKWAADCIEHNDDKDLNRENYVVGDQYDDLMYDWRFYDGRIVEPRFDASTGIWYFFKCMIGGDIPFGQKKVRLCNVTQNTNRCTQKVFPFFARCVRVE